jgi:hypothetical protein
MSKIPVPFEHRKFLRTALWRTLLLPVVILIFFVAAPSWYNSKLHTTFREQIAASSHLSEAEKAKRTAFFDKLDFQSIVFDSPVGFEHLREGFEKDGICGTFERLWAGLICSIILVVMLGASMLAMLSLNLDAKRSLRDLIRNYRLGWKIAMATAIIKLMLLIPLLAYPRNFCDSLRALLPNCPPAVGFYGGQFVCKSLLVFLFCLASFLAVSSGGISKRRFDVTANA